jgi:NAD(P)-dependent dehydrogenase (short-subunit alcohol dehydrogenase family)
LVADSLQGKVAIVTGGSSGIGAAVVHKLEIAGATCYAVSRHGPVRVDVSDQAAVRGFVESLERLDILICAAGDNVKKRRLDEITPEIWNHILAVNLSGAFYFINACLEKLRRARGQVVLISSVSAQWPDASGPAYQASKAGLTALARAAGFEEQNNGVRFSVINPGLVNTPLLLKRPAAPPPDVIAAMLQPEDIAEACLFILGLAPRTHIPELTILPTRLQALGRTSLANPEPAPE